MSDATKKRAIDQRGEEGAIGDRGARGIVAQPHPDETPEEQAEREGALQTSATVALPFPGPLDTVIVPASASPGLQALVETLRAKAAQ